MRSPRILLFLLSLLLCAEVAVALPEREIVSRIKRQPVISSNVASVGYSRHLHALEIEFTRGAVYRFLGVPREVYRSLMTSDSKGHFIAENIRGKFRFVRVRPSRHTRRATAVVQRD